MKALVNKGEDIKIVGIVQPSETANGLLLSTGIYYPESLTTHVIEEAKKSKSNPDVYLMAAARLDVKPSECIVFEDIIEAVRGAKSANMKVIAVYDKAAGYQKQDLIETADKYIMNFKELL